jgi:ABC-type oligopeptide transport system substrate-binding subunit/PKD repeat protein
VPYWIAPDTVPLVIGITGSPDLSLPWLDSNTLTILDQLFEPPFRQMGDGTFMSAAATGYTISPDGLVYTITFRDMIWSDGVPVTAQHYVDGLLRLLDPASGYDYPNPYYPIAGARAYNQGLTSDPNDVGIRALDAHMLEITLESPTAFFPTILAFPSFLPVRLDLIAQHGEAWMEPGNLVGNGPYLLVEHDAGHLLLERNPYYYASDETQFEQVGFAVILDENERLEAYRRGDIDALWTFARYEYPNIINDPELSQDIDISTQPGIQYLGINVDRYPTDNVLVRMALASAINRDYLVNTVIGAAWHTQATGVIPPELFGYQGDAVGYVYDELQAQNYLAEAGFPGGAGFPEIKLVANTGHEDIVEYIAQQWRDVLGIPVSVEYFEWSDYLAMLNDCRDHPAGCDYNVYRLGWMVDYTDPNNILADLFGPDSTSQYTGWDNARYRELLLLSLSEMDPAQRLEYIHEAEAILVENEAAILPLYFTNRLSLIKPGILPYFGPLIANLNLWSAIPTNQPPTDVVITAPVDPLPLTELVTVQVDFNDPDENDEHIVVIDWGDSTRTNATVTGLSAEAVHQYQSAGVYTITAIVTDLAGESSIATFKYVVIYDPNGGFVTGGGWINSPEGAYIPNPTLTGKATFGFVSRYKMGASVPTGETEFQFHVANLNFKSTYYNWLVVAGSKAKYKGSGTINGHGEYGFMLSAIDGTPDRFRIKIWDQFTGEVVYDNQLGAADDADPVTAIEGGSIVVHKTK